MMQCRVRHLLLDCPADTVGHMCFIKLNGALMELNIFKRVNEMVSNRDRG